jgi:hypothetical protein
MPGHDGWADVGAPRFSYQRHRVVTESDNETCALLCTTTSEIIAACDDFLATCLEGTEFIDLRNKSSPSGTSVMTDDVGIAFGGVRVATLWHRGIEKNPPQMQEDCAQDTQNTQMLPCGSQTVGHAFDRRTRVADMEPQAEPRFGQHLRALRASAYICAEILPLQCCRRMLTDALQGLCRRRGIWRL